MSLSLAVSLDWSFSKQIAATIDTLVITDVTHNRPASTTTPPRPLHGLCPYFQYCHTQAQSNTNALLCLIRFQNIENYFYFDFRFMSS